MSNYCQPCTEHNLSCLELKDNRLSIYEYIKRGCIFLGADYELVVGNTRERHIKDVRHMLMTFLTYRSRYSLVSIARGFNKLNHTTILNARRTTSNLCKTNPDFKMRYNALVEYLKTQTQ